MPLTMVVVVATTYGMSLKDIGSKLRAFRVSLGLSLREASVQLNVTHPALRSWEEGESPPWPMFRRAIEVWTHGTVKASDWPMSPRESELEHAAALVQPARPRAA